LRVLRSILRPREREKEIGLPDGWTGLSAMT